MGLDDLLISTGVDALIKLVSERGKVEVNEAARTLNASPQTVEDWAKVLEGEGLIKIQYQLTNIFLVWTPLAAAQQEQKRQVLGEKRTQTTGKLHTLAKGVEESKVELSALQQQLMSVQVRTQTRLQKLAADLAESDKLQTHVSSALDQKKAVLDQMKGDISALGKQLGEFESSLKSLPGQDGNPQAREEMKKLARAEDQLEGRLKSATKLFDGVEADIKGMQERLAADHTLEDLNQLKKVVDDLSFARAEMEKTSQTMLNETKMMGEELGRLSARIKEVEGRKSEKFSPKKMREQADALGKSVQKERADVLESLEKSLADVRKQVQAYTQAQYQYQNISARIESLRAVLSQSTTELSQMEKGLLAASDTYARDLSEARSDLAAEKEEYDHLAAKAKQVEYVLGNLQAVRSEGEALALKLRGIIKESELYGLTAPVKAAEGGHAAKGGARSGGHAGAGGAPAPGSITLPPELARRIAITTQEEEAFEKKRQELTLLVRKMWEEDRKPKNG